MIEQIKDNGAFHVRQFASLWELVEHCRTAPRKWNQWSSHTNPRETSWDDNVGLEGAYKLAQEGWEEGVRNIHARMADLPAGMLPTRHYSYAGDFPDVGRCVAGDPFNMVRRGHAHRQRPTMVLAMNVAISGGVPASSLMNYGAAMCAIVDSLENRDIRVEVWGIDYAASSGKKSAISWCIKRAQDPLDMSSIAFSLGHPGMARRILFAAQERLVQSCEMFGYGAPTAPTTKCFVDAPDDAVIVAGVGQHFSRAKTLTDAMALCKEQVNQAVGEDIVDLEVL